MEVDNYSDFNSIYHPVIPKYAFSIHIPQNLTRRLIIDSPFNNKTIISYGLIVYAKNTNRSILIQRKHSVEFLLYMRGLYRISHLALLLSAITLIEGNIIKDCLMQGEEYFKNILLNELKFERRDIAYALVRFHETQKEVELLLATLNLENNTLKWNWPKGRINNFPEKEDPFTCAKREFVEEVEIKIPEALFISDNYITDNIKTVSGKDIESHYWLYVIADEIPLPEVKYNPEVSDRKWVDINEAMAILDCKDNVKSIIHGYLYS